VGICAYNGLMTNTGNPFDYGDPYIEWNEENDYTDEVEHADEQDLEDMANYFDPIEQGMYDDDPNPYHGDYSEM
jgi:hypothetical protein